MKSVRVVLSAVAVGCVLLGFFFVPLPVTRVRQTGLVQVQPVDVEQVPVKVAGLLEKIYVTEGQRVKADTILAQFRSLDLESQERDARTQLLINKELVDFCENLDTRTRDQRERTELKKTKAKYVKDLAEAKAHSKIIEESAKRLILRAPRDGVVMGLPKIDEVGKRWDKDQETPFCNIGNPAKLRVLVPVSPDDYDLIRDNLKKLDARKQNLAVTIRVHGRDTRTWQGRVAHLPESEAKEVPMALTNRGGGPLAIKQGDDPKKFAPQNQVYLIGVDFEDPDQAVCPGVLAQVKIHNEYRTAAWWVWRTLSATFDLGLL